MKNLIYYALSEKGNRSENQDSYGCFTSAEESLFVVSDGMGGHQDGAYASRTIIEMLTQWWIDRQEKEPNKNSIPTLEIKDIIAKANDKIFNGTPAGQICGATVVMLWCTKDKYTVLWTGDSHCYLTQPSADRIVTTQIMIDDVWENEPAWTTGLTPEQIAVHPNRGKLVHAVGAEPINKVTLNSGMLESGTLFALCSDGIYKYLKEDTFENHLAKMMTGESSLEEEADLLRSDVQAAGARDNFTGIFIRVE